MCASCSDCCGQWVMGFEPIPLTFTMHGNAEVVTWNPLIHVRCYIAVFYDRVGTSRHARYFNGMNSEHFFQNQWKISLLLYLYGTYVSRVTRCFCDAQFFAKFRPGFYRISRFLQKWTSISSTDVQIFHFNNLFYYYLLLLHTVSTKSIRTYKEDI